MLADKEITYIVTLDAQALLSEARVDPEGLVHRYLGGDLGTPTRMIALMNAQMDAPAEQIGRYELGDQGVVIVRRRQSGLVCVMDEASVLSFLDEL